MARDARKYLHDALNASESARQYVSEIEFSEFKDNSLIQSAVERQLQILGEAVWQLEKYFPEISSSITHCREIIGFRHVLVHDYDKLELETVWGILAKYLAPLEIELANLLHPESDQ